MAEGEGPAPGEGGLRGPEGLLFTGDAIQELTPEQLAAIGEFANRMYGVEMRHVRSVEQELGDVAVSCGGEITEPVPATREDFRAFARDRELSASLAGRSWSTVWRMATEHPRGQREDRPAIRILDPGGDIGPVTIELTSLYHHIRHALKYEQWGFSGSQKQDTFLVDLINQTLQPEVPLPSLL